MSRRHQPRKLWEKKGGKRAELHQDISIKKGNTPEHRRGGREVLWGRLVPRGRRGEDILNAWARVYLFTKTATRGKKKQDKSRKKKRKFAEKGGWPR